MPEPQVPLWITVGGSFGIGSFVGGLITQVLSAKQRHQEWVKDNKKLEWRETIDETDRSINWMRCAFERGVAGAASDPAKDYMAGMGVGSTVVRNRNFIADVLKQSGITAKWWEMAGYMSSVGSPRDPEQQGGMPTMNGYNTMANAFREELIRASGEDLGIMK